jgi:Transposase DDE domain
MGRVAQKKVNRNRQKQARRMNRINQNRKQRKRVGIALTKEQKKERSEKLKRRKEARQRRKELIAANIESAKRKRIQEVLSSIFSEKALDQLAKTTGFIKRKAILTAFSFVYIISFGFFGDGHKSLVCLVLGLKNFFGVDITAQGLSKRLNTKGSSNFLKATLQKLIEAQLSIGLKTRLSKLFPMFSSIILEDSTTIELNENLSEDFQGAGGGASKSALKIQFIFDILTNLVYGIQITNGITPDQARVQDVIAYLKPSSLSIRDLGYFSIPALRMIQNKCAYYLSRLSITSYVYLNENDVEPLNVPEFLKKKHAEGVSSINVLVYVGQKERFKTRLVAEKVPAKVSKQRIAKYKEERKKAPSQYYEEWCGYSIFITNIPKSIFSGRMIIDLYKIRWQIELMFLNFKSNVEIDIIKGTNEHRVEGLVYGKLITIVTAYIVQNYAAYIAGKREISGYKLTNWLKNDDNLHQAIRKEGISLLLITLECDILLVCKQQRKRKTTLEIIERSLQMEQDNTSEAQGP